MRSNIVLVSFLVMVVLTALLLFPLLKYRYGLNGRATFLIVAFLTSKALIRTHNGFEGLKCTNTETFVNSSFNLQKAFFATFFK
ncbi:hypothetical protein GGTG_09008 [Gaeumannomyces tritici R3-111a-1]|uniref:Uncharacterized protein n=1 Tax=Gaeumannomyces tritici (strain R3-111a-1) TaxID=644352 RepID=J3P667_GAET3|nr:hypothetical protein GGTG_09008 [Gaeumannomyces tritici R3-111a-1]EJT72141.1 hypothetical protein GGTG_09008 [Gaeumannomyces tritici R3-111a-1]